MLADDDNAVGARHSAHTRRGRGVSLFELREEGGGIHPAMIATARAARQVPGGLFRTFAGPRCLPAPAREEAEQREHEDHDEDDPEDAHAISCLPFPVDCRPARSDSAWDQRKNTRPGYVTRCVTRVAPPQLPHRTAGPSGSKDPYVVRSQPGRRVQVRPDHGRRGPEGWRRRLASHVPPEVTHRPRGRWNGPCDSGGLLVRQAPDRGLSCEPSQVCNPQGPQI